MAIIARDERRIKFKILPIPNSLKTKNKVIEIEMIKPFRVFPRSNENTKSKKIKTKTKNKLIVKLLFGGKK